MKRLITICLAFLLLGSMFAGRSFGQIDPETILGVWLLDEGSGDLAEDASGNGYDGTLTGAPTWVTGRFGSALEFNGSSGHVNCGNDPALNVNVFSVSFWCNIPNTQGWNHMISRGQHEASGTPGSVNWGVMMYEGQQTILFETFNNTAWVGINTATSINEWHHVVATYDGTTMQLYHDGALGASASAGILLDETRAFLIGARSDAGAAGGFFAGRLDEVGYFNAVLTPEDIETIMNDGLAEILGGSQVAVKPQPAIGQTDVPRDPALSWTPGDFAAAHNVYLSDNYTDVSSGAPGALIAERITEPHVAPGRLAYETTYYWRVDEVNAAPDYTIFEGNIWSFTVEPFVYPISGVIATSSAASNAAEGPENTVNGSGLNANDEHSTVAADMWLTLPGQEGVSIQYEFDRVYKLHEMLVWNYNEQFELVLGFGIKDVTVEYSQDGTDWVMLGEMELARGTARATYTANTTVDMQGVAARFVRLTVNSGWGGLGQYGLSEVRFLHIPANPRDPQPAHGTTDVDPAATLSWRPGREAASHEIYLGTNPDDLSMIATVSQTSFAPADLQLGRTYYWQVVEVNETEAISTWAGDLWSFSTQEYRFIEGFESYTDDIDAGEAIFDTWLDGWVNNTGSTVGHLETPFAEKTIVRSGKQSMPLTYNNTDSPYYSEAVRTWDTPQDWTGNGANTLVLHLRGNPPVFFERADGSILMGSTGGDIWDSADAFRLAYKRLSGNGSIVARVDSIVNTSAWAKGGVMIREGLDPGSKHAMVVVTPGNGVALQNRPTMNQASLSINEVGLVAPYWVKLTRTGDSLTAERSEDGLTWVPITADAAASTLTISMANDVYIGLALVSNNAGASPTAAEFSNVATTGNVTGQWQTADIGAGQLASNNPQPLYVRIADSAGQSATVTHESLEAVLSLAWQPWQIPFGDLGGVNLARISEMTIGIGNRTSPTAGGAGTIYIDDIGFGSPAVDATEVAP
ncbi:MAG: LamG-like jellyroll fold domain-containing protein [Sedimentisphaerales bacterium]|nr:LamG-like jellyroll fold domain-containing protein [Sedimentisphaerales bacterium]